MIKIGIAEDQALFRKGIVALINSFNGVEVTEEAENGKELLDAYEEIVECQEELPNITILDLNMPILDGIKTTSKLKERYPSKKIIIISSFDDEDIIVHLYEKGANAYLDKNSDPQEVELAIKEVFSNDFYFNEAAKKALEEVEIESSDRIILRPEDELTEREMEVLRHTCYARSTEEIAKLMHLSARTVEGHRQKLLQKTNCKNTTNLVLFALRAKLINVSEIKISLA